MSRSGALLTVTILLFGVVAHAQSTSPSSGSFRFELTRRAPWMRPGMDGYIYNDSRYRVGNVQLRARVVDATGRVVRESSAYVLGDVTPGGRAFFTLPVIAEHESYELTVESFNLISREGP